MSKPNDQPKEEVKTEPTPEVDSFTVTTPDTGFRGERAGVKFFDGQATVEDRAKAIELLDLGYTVKPNPRKAKASK